MQDVGSLFVALGLLILLAVTSMRYGVDSRDGFRTRREGRALRGIVWDVPSAAPKPLKPTQPEDSRPVLAPADCGLAPCPT